MAFALPQVPDDTAIDPACPKEKLDIVHLSMTAFF